MSGTQTTDSTLLSVWSRFIEIAGEECLDRGMSRRTVPVYRAALWGLYRFAGCSPGAVTGDIVHSYMASLTRKHLSASWLATCISAIRLVFDGLLKRGVTVHCRTPRRPKTLPVACSAQDVLRLIYAGKTVRDQFILGLLYGCGMKVGELVRLRWRDVDLAQTRMHAPGDRMLRARWLQIPNALLNVVQKGVSTRPADEFIFEGRCEGGHMAERSVQKMLRGIASRVGLSTTACCMTLRHAYAFAQLDAGVKPWELQVLLGHKNINSTLRYMQASIPEGVVSPLDLRADTEARV